MDIIALQPGTLLDKICKTVGSRKRKAMVSRHSCNVTLSGTYWDSGSRSSYSLVDLNTMQVQPQAHHAPVQFGGPREDPVIVLLPHQAVVKTGTFLGKPATPVVFLHPDCDKM